MSDRLHPTDWRVIVPEFRERFASRIVKTMPHNTPRGANFVTPDFLGYVRTADGDVVEVTTGMGFGGERIFGLTWARLDDGTVDPRDHCVFSLDDVEAALT